MPREVQKLQDAIESIPGVTDAVVPGFKHEQGYCGLAVIKKVGEEVSVAPAQMMVIDRGITCHKFVKRNRK